jgi:general secretion pathway protein H
MKNQKGVTLLELIVVMVIIAIGATLMAPGISSWMPHYRLRNATRDIASTMRIAQMKAISNNLTYQVSFDPGNRSYILQYQDTGGGLVNDGDLQVLNNGVQFDTTFAGNIAIFRSDSTITGGNVNLVNTKGQKTIRLAGRRIRIE